MKYRKLTEDGDYSFGGNNEDFISGVDAIAQAIKTKILLFYYEWWEDLGQGIPMFQSIIGQTNQELIKTSVINLVEERVLEVEGVSYVDDVQVEVDKYSRSLSLRLTATTIDGEKAEVEVQV